MARTRNPWLKVGLDAAMLGIESAQVVSLRMSKLAAGGPGAAAEAGRMVGEKLEALGTLQTLAATGALGLTAPRLTSRSLAHYRRKVRQNRRRLLRQR